MTAKRHAAKIKERQMTSSGGEVIISFAEAVRRLVDGPMIHCFMNPSANVLLGAHWDRASVMRALAEAEEIHETGPAAQATGHGVACLLKVTGDYAFFATRPTDPDAASPSPRAPSGPAEER